MQAPKALGIKRLQHPDGTELMSDHTFAAASGTRPCIRTIWIEETAAGHRRFVTAYPANPQRTTR